MRERARNRSKDILRGVERDTLGQISCMDISSNDGSASRGGLPTNFTGIGFLDVIVNGELTSQRRTTRIEVDEIQVGYAARLLQPACITRRGVLLHYLLLGCALGLNK